MCKPLSGIRGVRLLLIIALAVCQCACKNPLQTSQPFKWATADRRKLDEALLELVRIQNPDPADLQIDPERRQREIRQIKEQMNALQDAAEARCATEEWKAQMKDGRQYECKRYHPVMCTHLFNQDCIANIPNDPLIKQLREQSEKIESNTRQMEVRARAKREMARQSVQKLIGPYAGAQGIELVVDSNSGAVLFGAGGLSLDITEALLSTIRTNPPDVRMSAEQVDALGSRAAY